MKKLFLVVIVIFSLTVIGNERIRVGATPVPHAEILEFVKESFEERGYTLDIIVFNDYVLPNIALSSGDLHANYFQHVPYLETFTEQRGISNLVNAGAIHVEPMGFYLKKAFEDLSAGDTIAIPNDPTNGGRALLLLHNNGLIVLRDAERLDPTVRDITGNPLGLRFNEVDAGFIPRVFKDDPKVAGAVINTNYALTIGLNALEDAEFVEGAESPYANVIAVRNEDIEKQWIRDLLEVLRSDEVREFIISRYGGAVVPTF